jgi:phosphoglycerol transferase MdoB-like AlkP superfamily enzyme
LSAQGIFFTNFYATGSRTARALEAVLSSFPPVPGSSIIKRPKSDGFFTLADVFKTADYDTLFVYGGRGLFDHMAHFARANGFDRFIEQKDYPHPTFTSAWGVCDEDIFHRAIDEFDALDKAGKRFFGVVLTVSNHKPYTYPAGRIDLDPDQHRRENAFKYADWAMGDFFEKAAQKPFFKNTVFAFLGDHGARVYGADFIPIDSYEVPLLIYAPGRLKPRRVDTMSCSMDVAPTLLGLTDITYRSVFFGRDILDLQPEQGYALMQHDRDLGFLQGDRLAVLGVPKTGRLFHLDRATRRFTPIPRPDLDGVRQLQTAASFYQTAYSFYNNRTYRLSPGAAEPARVPQEHPRDLPPPAKAVP